MVNQYPHKVLFTVQPTATKDADGNWISSGDPEINEWAGRFEISSGSRSAYITGADGVQIAVKGVIYLPLPVDRIKEGTKVQVMDGDSVLIDSVVKQFSKGQFNARVWV